MTAERIEKLRYRAWRRGLRETDLLLGPFADHYLGGFGEERLAEFERLLEAPDTDLYSWIVGRQSTPDAYAGEVMALLQAFRPGSQPPAQPAGA